MTVRNDIKREPPDGFWPVGHLETLGRCPVCDSVPRVLMHGDLRDRIFFAAPGSWTMWRCNDCRSAYLDPRPDEPSIGDAYSHYYTHDTAPPGDRPRLKTRNAKAIVRNSLRNSQLGTAFRPSIPLGPLSRLVPARYKRSIASQFRHLPRLRPGANVLDIGCGDASWLGLAQEAGWNATGIEPDIAARRSAPDGVEILASLEELDARPRHFDHITMNHVIEHVHHPRALLGSCFNLLKPGGTIHIETPNVDAPTHERFGADWRGLEPPRHLALFSADALIGALQASGFINIVPRQRISPALFLAVQSERIARHEDPYAQPTPETDGSIDSEARPEFLSISARRPL